MKAKRPARERKRDRIAEARRLREVQRAKQTRRKPRR